MQSTRRIAVRAANAIVLALVIGMVASADDGLWPAERLASPVRTRLPGRRDADVGWVRLSQTSAADGKGTTGDSDASDSGPTSPESGSDSRPAHETDDKKPRSGRVKTLFRWSYEAKDGLEEDGDPEKVEPLATDRPDFTEASSTVGRGVFQIESGYTYLQDRNDGTTLRRHSWGEALFRYGVLADWLELRFAVFPVTEYTSDEGTTSGTEDLYLGVKLALTEQSGWLPEMAIVPQMTVPAGSSRFCTGETLPGVNWLYGWDVTDRLTTAGSTQFNKAIDDKGDTYLDCAQSWTIGYALTDRFSVYSEWFAFFPSSAETARVEHYYDGGFACLVTDDIQWDVRAGIGLNDAAADFFTGVGLSVRFR